MHWIVMVPTPPLDPRPRLNFLRTRQHRAGHGTSSPDTFTQQTGALRIASSRAHRRTGHGKTTAHMGGSEPQSTGHTERRRAHVQVTGPTGHEQIRARRHWASVNPCSVAAQLPGAWSLWASRGHMAPGLWGHGLPRLSSTHSTHTHMQSRLTGGVPPQRPS